MIILKESNSKFTTEKLAMNLLREDDIVIYEGKYYKITNISRHKGQYLVDLEDLKGNKHKENLDPGERMIALVDHDANRVYREVRFTLINHDDQPYYQYQDRPRKVEGFTINRDIINSLYKEFKGYLVRDISISDLKLGK